jgi:hypothetical protein
MEILAKYGIQQTFYFTMVKAGSTDLAASGDWTPAATDADIIKDGGTTAQCTNTIVSEGDVIWSLTLTAAEMQAGRICISIIDSATKAVEDNVLIINTQFSGQLEASAGIIIGEVDTATEAASTTTMEAFRISPNTTEETTADHYNGRLILWTTGVLLGQLTDITDYVLQNSKERFTFTATTEAPGDGDRFVVL